MINYAHRGASEYAPENTLSSFYLGLLQGANGIETDVRRTKDGILVLFHDGTLDRVSNVSGKISEYTYEELLSVRIYGNSTSGFYDKIVTLEEFLEKFASYDIKFAIELKGEGVEEEALSMIRKYGILNKTTFTSFNFEYIKKIKQMDPKARVGWLTESPGDEEINKLLDISGEEMAPKAECVTKEMMDVLRDKGLAVRAWGVFNVQLMKKMCDLNVDGMTVNFPDRLFQHIKNSILYNDKRR